MLINQIMYGNILHMSLSSAEEEYHLILYQSHQ